MLAASTVGKVCAAVGRERILTLAALMALAVVPATFQVTVCVELPAQVDGGVAGW